MEVETADPLCKQLRTVTYTRTNTKSYFYIYFHEIGMFLTYCKNFISIVYLFISLIYISLNIFNYNPFKFVDSVHSPSRDNILFVSFLRISFRADINIRTRKNIIQNELIEGLF